MILIFHIIIKINKIQETKYLLNVSYILLASVTGDFCVFLITPMRVYHDFLVSFFGVLRAGTVLVS